MGAVHSADQSKEEQYPTYHCNISHPTTPTLPIGGNLPELRSPPRHGSRAAWNWQSLLKHCRKLGFSCVLSSAFHFPPKLVRGAQLKPQLQVTELGSAHREFEFCAWPAIVAIVLSCHKTLKKHKHLCVNISMALF